ncbi:MAG: VacJ family lipoprotein [Candidatus Brocadiaceae bacterium]|nr:VacJ family lipoprotein [Candidatus Brocadiaceae bacterium]
MKTRLPVVMALMLVAVGCAATRPADTAGQNPAVAAPGAAAGEVESEELPWPDEFDDGPEIRDPIEPVNRAFFGLNDKLYFWVLKPVAEGWAAVSPRPVRVGLRNAFDNLGVVGRAFNCAAQGDLKGTATEAARFGLNSTVGVLGVWDPALRWFDLKPRKEDFGQTLGHYGIGPGIHLTLPVMGPSCLRDAIGSIPEALMNPLTYVAGVSAVQRINDRSLGVWAYEDLKENALDPYIAVMSAYYQQRQHLVDENAAP